MKRNRSVAVLSLSIAAALCVVGLAGLAAAQKTMPFGGDQDVAFAKDVWKAMNGYMNWRMSSDVYPGQSPHGKFLRMYCNIINVNGKPYHAIIKDNYGGEGAGIDAVTKDPAKYLMAVTVMVQREPGYDDEDNNWFWVKYAPDGSIDKNPKGVAMAGRVAKGMKTGCIACHANAKQGDFIFSNDE
ncbi:MAG: cytochrome P460 family protein [bacterium]